MRLTIIKSDNEIYVDGFCVKVDCQSLDADVHAVQWNGERGWVEFVGDGFSPKPVNQDIDSVAPYQSLIDAAQSKITALTTQAEIQAAAVSSAAPTIPPQPDPSWIYNPTTNTWEAP